LAATPIPVSANENYFHCSDGSHIKWFDDAWHTYVRPDSWPSDFRIAIDESANNTNRNTDFTWERVFSGAEVYWQDLNDAGQPGVAGAAAIRFEGCTIADVTLYLNFPHFNASAHSKDQVKCTALHEFTHGVGFNHDNSLPLTVMYGDHGQRCHTNLLRYLTEEDKAEINALY